MGIPGKYQVLVITLLCLQSVALLGGEANLNLYWSPPDAISSSSGGANLALPLGAVDLFVNPALLVQRRQKELQFSNLIDINADRFFSVALSYPLGARSQIGVGLVSRNQSNTVQKNSPDLIIRERTDDQFEAVLTYSRKFQNLSFGMSTKYFSWQNTADNSAANSKAVGIDFGSVYQFSSGLSVGAIYQQMLKFEPAEAVQAGPEGRFSIGVAWSPLYLPREKLKLLLSLNRFQGEAGQLNAGFTFTPVSEIGNLTNFTLRGGVGNFSLKGQPDFSQFSISPDETRRLTVGAGLGVRAGDGLKILFDYCYQIQEYISRQHIITTRIQF